MSFALLGIGTALPPGQLRQDEALGCARALGGPALAAATWLPAVYSHSGIKTRHQVLGRRLVDDLLNTTRESQSAFLPTESTPGLGPTTGTRMRAYAAEAPALAVRAAKIAVGESGVSPGAITHLVTVSCTGFVSPGVDFALIRELGLRATVERTHVGFMGCHGAINGLRVANAFATADPAARILLCAVELCSLHYHYGAEPDKVVANALFADGAAAVVGGRADQVESPWRIAATGSCLIPDSADAMAWVVGDQGFEMLLSRKIPVLIARHLRPWIERWLDGHGLTLSQIGSWAVHPGGPKILGAVEDGLGLPSAALVPSRAVYAECGNMSSPTVLFILERLRAARAARPCVALGFGPGLVAEAVLWR
ncbi:type III polyketide synthase [Fimbriiglobus ruber]|uniref:Chalcone synthase n=1 Tax=Fimbriiglobus ruber TaxID=1908690 RepID=A0A225DK07_9BACT|nr:type III polyketide synthase [Fimbriiglobus ruber]OWK36477.1 Chalcone synthase [Fimbriiglobus ruber]